jgi:hypothetical protein
MTENNKTLKPLEICCLLEFLTIGTQIKTEVFDKVIESEVIKKKFPEFVEFHNYTDSLKMLKNISKNIFNEFGCGVELDKVTNGTRIVSI